MTSPVICKIQAIYPRSKNKAGNKANMGDFLSYIENRPGTDRTITDSDLQLERQALKIKPDMNSFLKYASDRPGSTGLFDKNGVADLSQYAKDINLRQGPCWSIVLSLREDDAAELGYTDKTKWQDLIRQSMPQIIHDINIASDKAQWVAAYHQKEGHPHVHIVAWESGKPTRRAGRLTKTEMHNIKRTFFGRIYSDYTRIHSSLMSASREIAKTQLVIDLQKAVKTADQLRALYKDSPQYKELLKAGKLSGDAKSDYVKVKEKELYESFLQSRRAQKITVTQLKENQQTALTRAISDLADKLPYTKTSYARLPPEQQKLVDEIYERQLLKQPSIAKQRETYINEAAELAKKYTMDPAKLDQAKEKAKHQIDSRLKAEILNAAYASKKPQVCIDYKQLDQTVKVLDKQQEIGKISRHENIAVQKALEKAYVKVASILYSHAGIDAKETVQKISKTLGQEPEKISSQVKQHYQQCAIDKRYDRVTTPTKQDFRLAEAAIQKPINNPFVQQKDQQQQKSLLLGHAVSDLLRSVTQTLSAPPAPQAPTKTRTPKLRKIKKHKNQKERYHENDLFVRL